MASVYGIAANTLASGCWFQYEYCARDYNGRRREVSRTG